MNVLNRFTGPLRILVFRIYIFIYLNIYGFSGLSTRIINFKIRSRDRVKTDSNHRFLYVWPTARMKIPNSGFDSVRLNSNTVLIHIKPYNFSYTTHMARRGWLSRHEKDILIPSNPFFEPAGEKIKPDMTFQAQVEVMNNVLKTHSKSEFWIFCDSWRVKSL